MKTTLASRIKNSRTFSLPHLLTRGEIGVLVALFAIILVFSYIRPSFLTWGTWTIILRDTAELGIIAVGATLLIISGEFDLSVGSVFGFTGLSFAMLINGGIDPALAFALSLLMATSIGFINGIVTLSTGIPSFIVTLGGLFGIRGLALLLSGGRPNAFFGESQFLEWLGGMRFDVLGGLSVEAIWWILIVVIATLVLTKTRWGNWIFATGGDRESALAMGVPIKRVKLVMFMVSSTLAGLAGMMQFGRLGSMSPVEGTLFELEAIAAAVIGGTALTGGIGSIVGAALGTVTMLSLKIGLPAIGVSSYWYRILIGIILVLAVIVNHKLREVAQKRWQV